MIRKIIIAGWDELTDVQVYGKFAIHPPNGPRKESWKYYENFVVTHIATGRRVATHIDKQEVSKWSRALARQIARRLNEVLKETAPMDFSDQDIGTPNYKAFAKQARRIIQEVMQSAQEPQP